MKQAVWIWSGIAAAALSSMTPPAAAQDSYPSSPIRVVLGFPTGATTDLVARLLAQKLAAQMNVNAFADNKPGANANIAAEFVAKSRPDGYTLLFNTISVILSRAFGDKLGYDLFRSFAPVGRVASAPQVLVVHPSVPAGSVAEFIAHVKANPDKLAYGSAGTGSVTHLAPLLFLQANDLTALHVPYKGAGPAILDLVGNRIQFTMQSQAAVMPLVKDRRIKALAITSLKRSLVLPDVPTIAETIPGFEIGTWFGVLVPASTPAAVVRRLNSEIAKALQDADMKARLAQEGVEPTASTPEEYEAYLRGELDRWSKVIQSAGVKAE